MKRLLTAVILFALLTLTVQAQGLQRISILGDSYSTFKGYVPDSNAVWYNLPRDTKRTDVESVRQTWWWQVVNDGGYLLEKNDSYSGATVCYTGYRGEDYSDRSFITRLPRLGSPDILLILGNTNDSWCGAKVGEYKYADIKRDDLFFYRPALAKLLSEAQERYPNVRIYFIQNTELRNDIVESTKVICNHYGIPIIQLNDIAKQAGHPNIKGMKAIARQVLKAIKSDNILTKSNVIITAGQSNTDGRVSNRELPDYIKEHGYRHCLWSYGSDTLSGGGRFERYWPRVARPDNTERWGYDAVVYYLLDQKAKRDFYVIKESLGGTSIDTACISTSSMYWSADPAFLSATTAADKGGKSLLKAFTENIGACIDNELSHKNDGYEIKAFLWHQGESDKRMAAHYYDNLKAVVAYVRNYLISKTGDSHYAHLPFICGTFSTKSRDRSEEVVSALYRLAEEDNDFYVVDISDGTIQRDSLHFDAQGAELLGRRVFQQLITITENDW